MTRSGEASAHLLLADVDESATLGSAEAGSPPPRPAFERAYDEIEQRVDRLVGAVEAS